MKQKDTGTAPLWRKWLLGLFLACCIVPTGAATGRNLMKSPSGQVRAEVWTENGSLKYKIDHDGRPVLCPSTLQWSVGSAVMGLQTEIVSVCKGKKVCSEYPFLGNHSTTHNAYTPYMLVLKEKNGRNYRVEFRLYDDGVSFRYLTTTDCVSLIDDQTTFVLPTGTTCWMQHNINYYEASYKRYEAGKFADGLKAGPPVTVEYGKGLYASITEGGLVNFGGMALKTVSPNSLECLLSGRTFLTGRVATPWRVVMTGSLDDLVNNDIVTDVSEPLSPVFRGNINWVKPGNCVWSWLAGYGVTLDNMKRFTDWAAELGIPYNLVDEGWSHWEDKANGRDCWQMVKELADYSAAKGVKLWLWKAYPDRKGIPGIQTAEKRRAFFKKCKDLGIAGLKIDFFDAETQTVTKFYEDALRDAAEFGLMINFHGSNKPTGLSRTYPNELSREGIMGLEFGSSHADQDVVTPFTRFLAGHADFTPMAFQPRRMGNTTEAHQIAVTAVFLSPLRCYGGRPEDYLKHPAREVFLSIPTVWDETHVLPGSEIGERVLLAKRNGRDWYIVGLGNKQVSNQEVRLDFLPKGTTYRMTAVSDRPDGTCRITTGTASRATRLNLSMNTGGGYLARLQPAD